MPRHDRKPKPAPSSESAEPNPAQERLQKVLAAAGLGSRRKCEELITAGRVEIDHQVVTELGTKVDAQTQEIRVDGQSLKVERPVYYVLNKPAGILSTNYDQDGRTRVIDLIEDNRRLFTVGRLDQSSEGLILVTNDGGLANRLAHPRYGVQKRYHVQVAGHPTEETLEAIRRGVRLAEGYVQADEISVRKQLPKSAVLEMVLGEGKNREIRRMLAKLGHKVVRLIRVALGPLRLADLPSGAYRMLEPAELRALRGIAEGGATTKRPRKRGKFVRRGSEGTEQREPRASATGGVASRPRSKFQRPKPGRGEERGERGEGRTARPPREFTPRLDGKKQGTVIGSGDFPEPKPAREPRSTREPRASAGGGRPFKRGGGGKGRPTKGRFGKPGAGKPGARKPAFGKPRRGGGKP